MKDYLNAKHQATTRQLKSAQAAACCKKARGAGRAKAQTQQALHCKQTIKAYILTVPRELKTFQIHTTSTS